MPAIKTPQEMERIRAADAILVAERNKKFVPEKNKRIPLAYFEVSRYTEGQFRGLFAVEALSSAHPKAQRKVIADGVDMVVAMASLETSLRKRVFR